MTDLATVTGCCCGQDHQMAADVAAAYGAVTNGKPETVTIEVPGSGSWLVPRVYIACHGLAARDLAVLAARYGWERGGTRG